MTTQEIPAAQIRFKDIQVLNLELKNTGPLTKEASENLNFKLGFEVVTHPDIPSYFGLKFKIELYSKDSTFQINLIILAHFESNIKVNEEFLNSNFVKLNAPAIAFPYLRSYVSFVTLNSGYKSVILPTLNFAKSKNRGE